MKRSDVYQAEIQKWGNSFIIVVPAYLINTSRKFAEGELVDVRLSEVKG